MRRNHRGRAPFTIVGLIVTALALTFGASTAVAQEEATGWTPPSPAEMPTEFDWIQLPSGEWLGGEVRVLYNDSLEFDSDEMGLSKFDWEDIVEMRTVRVLEVRPIRGESVTGKVIVKDGKITIMGDTTTTFDQLQVLSMTAGVPKESNFWSGDISASANYQSGNTDKETFNAHALIKRRTVEQRMIFEYIGNYDETESEETENNHRLTGKWDRFVTDRWFWTPVSAEYFKDKFQNIEHRVTVGPAVGYQIIDNSTTEWWASLGPAYTKTWFQDVQPGESDSEDSFAAQANTRFDHELTGDIDIWTDYRGLFANDDAGGYQHRLEAGIAYEIIGDLDFRVTWIWDHISEPTEDADGDEPEKDDTQLLFGVGYTF